MTPALEAVYADGWDDGVVIPLTRDQAEGRDAAAWSSGWGDGLYPTWTGRDGTGGIVCFVADMLLFQTD